MPPVGFEPKISAGERPQAARRSEKNISCIFVLFNNAAKISTYTAPSGKMTTSVASLYLPRKTEKNHDKISPKIVCGLRIKPTTEELPKPGVRAFGRDF